MIPTGMASPKMKARLLEEEDEVLVLSLLLGV
jgi:hypothetical protein